MSTDERALGERVAALEARADSLEVGIRELYRDIHGPPRDESIRGRLHILENAEAAAKAAEAALETAKAVQQQQGIQHFSKAEKVIGLLFAFVIAACAVVSVALTIVHYS